MTLRSRRSALLALGLGFGLAAASCQRTPPPVPAPPPVAPLPPARVLSLCERPAQPAATSLDPTMETSFAAFARTHLEKLRTAGAAQRPPGGPKEIGSEFETELRRTGNSEAPWVGVLRYCERVLRCADGSADSCTPSKRSIVTEIFRFQAGRWVY